MFVQFRCPLDTSSMIYTVAKISKEQKLLVVSVHPLTSQKNGRKFLSFSMLKKKLPISRREGRSKRVSLQKSQLVLVKKTAAVEGAIDDSRQSASVGGGGRRRPQTQDFGQDGRVLGQKTQEFDGQRVDCAQSLVTRHKLHRIQTLRPTTTRLRRRLEWGGQKCRIHRTRRHRQCSLFFIRRNRKRLLPHFVHAT